MVKNRCKNHVKVAADFREGHHYALARFACDIMQGSCHDPITKKSKRIKPPWNPWELFMPPLSSHYKSYWNPNSNLWRGTVHGTLEQQPLLWIHRACLAARVWFLFQPLRHWSEKAGSIWYFFIFSSIPTKKRSGQVGPRWTYAGQSQTIGFLLKWEFQHPKTEVLYCIRPYFVGIFPYIGLIYTYIYSIY